jgi:hypothetical protein
LSTGGGAHGSYEVTVSVPPFVVTPRDALGTLLGPHGGFGGGGGGLPAHNALEEFVAQFGADGGGGTHNPDDVSQTVFGGG